MNYRLNAKYSVILMSRRSNAPYRDKILEDGITVEYEGHDEPKTDSNRNPKMVDQPIITKTGKLTQNGLFAKAVEAFRRGERKPELVKVYEKLFNGVWSLKGFFHLVDYMNVFDGTRNVFVFRLQLADIGENLPDFDGELKNTRLIPSEVKKEVWKRDGGKCVLCGKVSNLHFDHDLPFSKGGTSLTAANVRLLCAEHNLKKSDKIE